MKKKTSWIVASAALGTVAGLFVVKQLAPTIPSKAKAINNFNLEKYLGKWYEIARMDFHFEKNLIKTTAYYSLNEDGSVKVLNRGWNHKKKEWTSAHGKAQFLKDKEEGRLKVSFFKPFYSGYNIIDVDENYQYALVAGKNLKYLWILSRKKQIPEEIKQRFLKLADEIGYETEKLYWVPQY